MTTTNGIQERLHKRADNELKEAVERAAKNMTVALNEIHSQHHPMHTDITLKESSENEAHIKLGYNQVIQKLSNAFIAKVRDSYREQVIREFMEKVDTLHDQIDELRDEIQHN